MTRSIRLAVLVGVVVFVCSALSYAVYTDSQHAGLQKLEATGIWVVGFALVFVADRVTRPKR